MWLQICTRHFFSTARPIIAQCQILSIFWCTILLCDCKFVQDTQDDRRRTWHVHLHPHAFTWDFSREEDSLPKMPKRTCHAHPHPHAFTWGFSREEDSLPIMPKRTWHAHPHQHAFTGGFREEDSFPIMPKPIWAAHPHPHAFTGDFREEDSLPIMPKRTWHAHPHPHALQEISGRRTASDDLSRVETGRDATAAVAPVSVWLRGGTALV